MNRIGKYTVVGQLGRGAMGVVYRARDPVIQRDVAIKLIRKSDLAPEEASHTLARFKREAQAAGNLNHSNIVAVYEYGEDEEIAFIAMECVIGKSLRDHLLAGFRPEFREFPEVIDQLLEGLDYSHSRGVIHRDLKPANLLISESGVVKISDFGIARLETSHLTMVGEVMGTPFYMSPEQFRGEPADERSDIYSAAVIIYEILTGRRPFNGQGAAIMKQVLDDEPLPPSTFEPRIGPQLDVVILRALSKSPSDRPRGAREFSAQLHEAFRLQAGTLLPAVAVPAGRALAATNRSAAGMGTPTALPPAKVVVGNAAVLRRIIGAGAASRDSPPPLAEPALAAGEAQRPCVLFVDDEERVLNALRSVFRSSYDVQTASSGEQALEIVRGRPVSLVVSDQRMPGLAGVDVLRRVKELSPTTVRILLTGYSDLAAIVGSINEGEVFRFINKPWNQQELTATVAEAVAIATALQACPPPREAELRPRDAAVLVLNEEPTYRALRELMSGGCLVSHATTLDEAFSVLARSEVGVLIADLESTLVDHAVLFKALKKEYPATLVIVTTGASDSELMISLINEARIFRFVNKPVNLALLRQHVISALDRYEQFKASPQLAGTQSPSRSPSPRDTSLMQSLLSRLRSVRALMGAGVRA